MAFSKECFLGSDFSNVHTKTVKMKFISETTVIKMSYSKSQTSRLYRVCLNTDLQVLQQIKSVQGILCSSVLQQSTRGVKALG